MKLIILALAVCAAALAQQVFPPSGGVPPGTTVSGSNITFPGNLSIGATVHTGAISGDAGAAINALFVTAGRVIVSDQDLTVSTTINVPLGKELQLGKGTVTCSTFPCITYQSASTIRGKARGSSGSYLVGTIPAGIANPAAPAVTPTCSGTCTTAYPYVVVAYNSKGHTARSAPTSVNNAATLDGTHYNTITTAAVTGSTGCDVWRQDPFAVHGKITAAPVTCGSAVVDNGLAGDLLFAYTVNTTGGAFIRSAADGVDYAGVALENFTISETSARTLGSVGVDLTRTATSSLTGVETYQLSTGIQISQGSNYTDLYSVRAQSCEIGINFDGGTYENTLVSPVITQNTVAGIQVSGSDSLSAYTPRMVSNVTHVNLLKDQGYTSLYSPRFEVGTTGIVTETGPDCGPNFVYSPFQAAPTYKTDNCGLIASFGMGTLDMIVDGTAAAPSIRLRSESTTGFYKSAAGTLAISSQGSTAASFSATTSTVAGG